MSKRVGFLATGSEIVSGEIINTNSQQMAQKLFECGVEIGEHLCVDDQTDNLQAAFEFLITRHDLVLTTGGLGPTSDDCTRNVIADTFDLSLEFDQPTWDRIVERITARGFPVTENNKQQAYFPKGSRILVNDNGSANACLLEAFLASGVVLSHHPIQEQGEASMLDSVMNECGETLDKKSVFMLPGPPRECMPLFEAAVIPYVKKHGFTSDKKLYRWHIEGVGESRIAQILDKEVGEKYGLDIAYRAVKEGDQSGYVDVKVHLSPSAKTDELVRVLGESIAELKKQNTQ